MITDYTLSIDIFNEVIKHLNPENLRGVCRDIDSIVKLYYKSIEVNLAGIKCITMMNVLAYRIMTGVVKAEQLNIFIKMSISFGTDIKTADIVNRLINNYCEDTYVNTPSAILMLAFYTVKYEYILDNKSTDQFKIDNIFYHMFNILPHGTLILNRFNSCISDDSDEKSYDALSTFIIDVYNMYKAMIGDKYRYEIWQIDKIHNCTECDRNFDSCDCIIEGHSYIEYMPYLSECYQSDEQSGYPIKLYRVATDKYVPNWFYL